MKSLNFLKLIITTSTMASPSSKRHWHHRNGVKIPNDEISIDLSRNWPKKMDKEKVNKL
jgi:hypothetical protein